MKWDIKKQIGLLLLVLTTNLLAQPIGKIENGFNVDDFPQVSFVYHSYNPDELAKANFWHLKESGSDRDFDVEKLSNEIDDLPQTTLILWEDMAHNGYGQFNFVQKVLSGFLDHINIPASDKIAVSAFNRRKNTSTTLINLTNGFTNDKFQIKFAIQNYKHSKERYSVFPNRSDLYTAIREGMELLASQEGAKAIIVFTAGYSMKNSGADSESQVLLKAQQLHIPVYIFQYYYRSGVAPESEGFAKSTFGTFNSYKEVAIAERDLINLYPQIGKRYQGHDYKVSFISDAEHGAKSRMITLCVNGVDIQEQLLPPSYTIGTWIATHSWLVVFLVVLIIALIVCVLVYSRNQKKTDENNHQGLADLEQYHIQDNPQFTEQCQSNFASNAQQDWDEQKKQAEEERLCHLMRMRNVYPRLRCSIGTNTFTYELDKPRVFIGREQDNDLILNDDKVSRHHAEIVFNGSEFVIIDKQSTNKVILNGQFVERAILKSGDVIGLGEVILNFYI